MADDEESDAMLKALNAAKSALDCIRKTDITEVKSLSKPPELVKLVMEAVCVLFGISAKKSDDYWASAKQLLADGAFLSRLKSYDKDHINPEIMSTIRSKYISNPEFVNIPRVTKVSRAGAHFCKWVINMEKYDRLLKCIPSEKLPQIAPQIKPEPTKKLDGPFQTPRATMELSKYSNAYIRARAGFKFWPQQKPRPTPFGKHCIGMAKTTMGLANAI